MGRIVVGVDGSASSRQALRWAATEAEQRGCDVLAVQSWHDPAFAGPGPSSVLQTDQAVGDAKAALDAVVRAERDVRPQLHIATALAEGSPVRSLLQRVDDGDELVVGSRGNGGFLGLELGSVSTKAARRSPVPVVVVRGEHDGTLRSDVVVGVDGSACSRRALAWAAAWSRAHDKELVVLLAWNHLEPQRVDGPSGFDPEYDDAAARAVLDSIVADVIGTRANPRIRTEVVCDRPARAILERSADACLIVVGRHGTPRWAPPDLGTTAVQVLHHATCPVAIIPDTEDRR